MLLWSPFFLVLLFCLFTLFLLYPRMYLLPVCIQPNSTYEDCVAVAVHMSTYEGSRCRTYDLQHSPSLLLLLLMVDQLVYHAVLLLYYILRSIYHPAHAFYTGWFRLNAQNCVPGNSSRRFFELNHEILHTYSGRQYLKLEEGGFLIWGFAVEISGF